MAKETLAKRFSILERNVCYAMRTFYNYTYDARNDCHPSFRNDRLRIHRYDSSHTDTCFETHHVHTLVLNKG